MLYFTLIPTNYLISQIKFVFFFIQNFIMLNLSIVIVDIFRKEISHYNENFKVIF